MFFYKYGCFIENPVYLKHFLGKFFLFFLKKLNWWLFYWTCCNWS